MKTKKDARRFLQAIKHGLTVAEFLTACNDMGVWFDEIATNAELLTAYNLLIK